MFPVPFRGCAISLGTLGLSNFLVFHPVLACRCLLWLCDDFKSSDHLHKDREYNGSILMSVHFKSKINFLADPPSYLIAQNVSYASLTRYWHWGSLAKIYSPGLETVHLETKASFVAASGNPNSCIQLLRDVEVVVMFYFTFCGYIVVKLCSRVWGFDTDVHCVMIKSDNLHTLRPKYLSLLCGEILRVLSSSHAEVHVLLC